MPIGSHRIGRLNAGMGGIAGAPSESQQKPKVQTSANAYFSNLLRMARDPIPRKIESTRLN